MKKRLRKKKHYGEFTEWGRQLIVTRNRKEGFDEFLDAFIEEAIEANGCYCGGGGSDDRLDVVVELGRRVVADIPLCKTEENYGVDWRTIRRAGLEAERRV
jgi:uncharacterized protein YggL (DUF469 family)